MNWKSLIPFVVAIVLGGVAVKLGRDYLRSAAAPSPESTKVVVAAVDLGPGHQIRAEDLTVNDWPQDQVPESAMTSADAAIGRVVAAPILKGVPVASALLAPPGAGAGLSALVPPGMRAISIEVSESGGMTGMLAPGCYVDVIGTLIDDRTRQPVARAIVENVKVTAVGQRLSPKAPEAAAEGQRQEPTYRTVTLLVTPKQAQTIELASSKTQPRLVVRGSGDSTVPESDSVTLDQLFGRTEEPRIRQVSVLAPPTTQAAVAAPVALPSPATQPTAVAAPVPQPVAAEPTITITRRSVQVLKRGDESTWTFETRSLGPVHKNTGDAAGQTPSQPKEPSPQQPPLQTAADVIKN